MPPEAALLFEVTLLEVRDGPDPQPLPPAVRLRLGAQRRERGNFHFARGDFTAALRSYRLALSALDGPAAGETGREGRGERGCWAGALRPLSLRSPPRAAGGRGAAGAARQVPQQLRGRRAEAAAGGGGAGGLRGGAVHQPGQRPGAAPAGAGGPHTAPYRPPARPGPAAHYRPLLSPQLLAQQGRDAEATLVLKKALELDPASKVRPDGARGSAGAGYRERWGGRGSRRSPAPGPSGVPPEPCLPQPPRRPQVIHAELSRLAKRRSAAARAAPQELLHGPQPPPSPGYVDGPG